VGKSGVDSVGVAARNRGVVDQAGEFVEFAGAAEDVYLGELFEYVEAVALSHAADDTYDKGGVSGFAMLELAEARPDFLFGVFTDGAGVVEDDVGGIAVFGGFIALGAELAENELGIEDVHLAAEGFEIELAGHWVRKAEG